MSSDAGTLDALVSAFQARTLDRSQWTHAAHLQVGMWYLLQHGEVDALTHLRADISALNEAHGNVNTDHSGYHDTITWAFLRLLAEVRRQQPPSASAEDLAAQAVAVLSDRTVLTRYYSPDVLASPEARRRVMPPDRQALP